MHQLDFHVQGMWLGRRSTTSCCVAYKMSPSFEARWSRSWRKSRRLVGTLFTRSLCLYWLKSGTTWWLIWYDLIVSDIFLTFSDNLAMYKLNQADNQCALWPFGCRGDRADVPLEMLCAPAASFYHLSTSWAVGSFLDHSWMNSLTFASTESYFWFWVSMLLPTIKLCSNNQTVLCLFQGPWTYWTEKWRLETDQFDFIRIKTATHYSSIPSWHEFGVREDVAV